MVRKRYQCHNCDNEFILSAEKEPRCPECGKLEVTFEEKLPSTLSQRLCNYFRPLYNFLFWPGRFYSRRELSRTLFTLLIVISTGALLTAGYQVEQVSAVSLLEKLVPRGKPSLAVSFFRNYHNFLAPLTVPGRFPRIFPGWLLVLVCLIFWEISAFVLLYLSQFIIRGEATAGQLAGLCAGTIWLPNFLISAFLFIFFRGISLNLWSPGVFPTGAFYILFYAVALLIVYQFLAGIKSLTRFGFIKFIFYLPLLFLIQIVGAGVYTGVLNLYLFPLLDLPATAPAVWVKTAYQLVLWPYLFFL